MSQTERAYADRDHPGNAVRSRVRCVGCGTMGCTTAWGPWCYSCNVERIDRISGFLDTMVAGVSHDPGGTRTPLPIGVVGSAVYGGENDCYRYRLEWVWDDTKPTLMAGMMNPSCAGHLNGDRTVAWVHRWSVRNGYGRLIVVNGAAYRAMDQARLAEVSDAVGPENDAHILRAASEAHTVVLGYGKPKVRSARDYGPRMQRLLRDAGVRLHAWKLTNDGTPSHPLYLPGGSSLIELGEAS